MRKTYTIPEVKQAITAELAKVDSGVGANMLLGTLDYCPPDALVRAHNLILWPEVELLCDNSRITAEGQMFIECSQQWPQVAQEFPDWKIGNIEIPERWAEESWHNNVCPSWSVPKTNLKVWVDYINPDERECSCARFGVSSENDNGEFTTLIETDDWSQVLWFVPMYKDELRTVRALAVVADMGTRDTFTRVIYAGDERGYGAGVKAGEVRFKADLLNSQYIVKVIKVTPIPKT